MLCLCSKHLFLLLLFKDPQEQDSLELGNELIPFGADYS